MRIAAALAMLLFIFVVGTFGYHTLENMSLFDGFYMTFITITTIGFSEVKSLSTEGRLLTIMISLIGIGIIAYIASQSTQLLFESQLFKMRAIKKQLSKMENHYIVTGYGRIGQRIAQDLKRADVNVVVVENRPATIERIENDNLLYVEGNAQEETVLEEAGIQRAKGLICTLSRDQENIFVTLMARELNEDVFILVRTNLNKNIRKILRAGADKVISPYEIGADRMANVILRPHVDQFMDRIMSGATQEHVFDEVRVSEGSELDGKTLAGAEIRQKYFIVIVAIVPDNTEKIVFNPGSDDELKSGDTLIVLGDAERIRHFRTEGCNDNRSLSERVENHDFLSSIGFNEVLNQPRS